MDAPDPPPGGGEGRFSFGGSYEAQALARSLGVPVEELSEHACFIPVPAGPNGAPASVAGAMSYAIFKQVAQPELAMRVLERAVAPEALAEDLEHSEYGAALRRYPAGAAGIDGAERVRVMNLVSDLITGDCGGYQAVLAVHAEGGLEAEKLTILARYPQERALGYSGWLAGLPSEADPPR